MKPLPKVQAGGILRTSLDNTWRTPERINAAARAYFQGPAPFDAATGLENPVGALRFCAGRLDVVPPLTRKIRTGPRRGEMWVEPEWKTRARGRARRVHLLASAARGADLSVRAWVDGRPAEAWLEVARAESAAAMPFCSGLEVAWDWPTWVNPPYGREIRAWLAKITEEAERGTEVVGLLPCARWEQGYFHKALRAANALCLIRSRVAFISSIDNVPVGGNPYASMLVGWNTDRSRWLEAFGPLGLCLDVKPTRRRRARVGPIAPWPSDSLFGSLCEGGV